MQETSLQAWHQIKNRRGTNQQKVYNMIVYLGEANNRELSEILNWPINRITPRVKELRDKRLVGVSRTGKDQKTKRMTIYWKVVK